MKFGKASDELAPGRRTQLQRDGWNGVGMFVRAQFPDENSKMTHPYLYIVVPGCEEGTRQLPWQPAQVDIFADDWSVSEY